MEGGAPPLQGKDVNFILLSVDPYQGKLYSMPTVSLILGIILHLYPAVEMEVIGEHGRKANY